MSLTQSAVRNRILKGLSEADFALLTPHASGREFKLRELLSEANGPIRDFYFPETGMMSVITADDAEIGIIGREGLAGLPAFLGVESSPFTIMCQMPSAGMSISVASFMSAATTSPTLTQTILKYSHIFSVQVASTAQANGNYTVEQRLARWILMCRDRAEDDEIILTHEFLAMMLGVRRPGVTVALHVLEGHGYIRSTRGRLVVRDVERLQDFADGSYGLSEAEYDRVMSSSPNGSLPLAS